MIVIEKKKINWLLILQGWAMLWVVIGHAFIGDYGNQANWPVWERGLMGIAYSFHMPLFMLVSGWLFYRTRLNINKFDNSGGGYLYIIKDKSLRILLPGFIFSIVALIVKLVFPGDVSRQASLSLYDILLSYLYPFNNPFRELWFVAALFWMFLLTPLWKFVLQYKWSTLLTFVLLLALHFYHPATQLLALDKTCLHALWFFTGIVLSKKDIVDILFNKNPLVTLSVGALVYAIGLIVVSAFLKTVGGIVFSFGFALIADRYLPKLFFTFRNYTYQIFLIGIFAQMFVKILYHHVTMPYIAAYILCILMGIYVPVFVSKLVEKINWKPLSLCMGLKTK